MSTEKDDSTAQLLEYEEMKYIAKFENHITKSCFNKCASSLRSKHLGQGEKTCVENCTAKFVSALNRISLRMEDIEKELASKQ